MSKRSSRKASGTYRDYTEDELVTSSDNSATESEREASKDVRPAIAFALCHCTALALGTASEC